MKHLFLSIAFCGCSAVAHSQKLIDQEDPFTGNHTKAAVVVLGKSIAPTGQALSFILINGKNAISYVWPVAYGSFNNANVNDMSLLFKMDDDTVIKFKADSSISKITDNLITVNAYITDAQLLKLISNTIAKFRFGAKDDIGPDLDNYLFTDRNRKQVKKAAAFMLGMQEVEDQN